MSATDVIAAIALAGAVKPRRPAPAPAQDEPARSRVRIRSGRVRVLRPKGWATTLPPTPRGRGRNRRIGLAPPALQFRSGKGFEPTSAGNSALPSPRLARVSAGDRPACVAAPAAADFAIAGCSLTLDVKASTARVALVSIDHKEAPCSPLLEPVTD